MKAISTPSSFQTKLLTTFIFSHSHLEKLDLFCMTQVSAKIRKNEILQYIGRVFQFLFHSQLYNYVICKSRTKESQAQNHFLSSRTIFFFFPSNITVHVPAKEHGMFRFRRTYAASFMTQHDSLRVEQHSFHLCLPVTACAG